MCSAKWMGAALAASLVLALVGCKPSYDVIPVEGTLTYDGQAVSDIIVTFKPTEGRASQGTTDESGKFIMGYTMEQQGVEPGAHEITVLFSPPEEGAAPGELQQQVLDDFEQNGPIEVTIEEAQENYEIKLPR